MPVMNFHSKSVQASTSGAAQLHQQPPPSPAVPPSPTLTNPDMILPYEDERVSATPSPPFGMSARSNMNSMQHWLYRNQSFQRNNTGGDSNHNLDIPASEIGVAISLPSGTENKSFSRSMWTYEGRQPGRPLSDIGEEEDAASQNDGYTTHAGQEQRQDDERSETGSNASGSTISAGSDRRQWDRFKHQSADGAQHGKNGFGGQGVAQDNGESGRYSSTGYRSDRPDSSMESIEEQEEEGGNGSGDETASMILTNEAERILENAKKKLTLMEGNLNKARSSIRISPSPSPSPTSLPLGPGGLYKSIAQSDRRRQRQTSSQDAGNNWHSRGQSETHLPSTWRSRIPVAEQKYNYRSVSAMGTAGISGYGAGDRSSYHESSRSYLTHRASTNSFNYRPLMRSPSGNDSRRSSPRETPSPAAGRGFGTSTTKEIPKITTMEEFNSAYPSDGPPSRAQSQLQVRDLKDQMKGLQIKISTLKVKTQEDSLRRRSLQSLRTPSPFTDAEQWYTSSMELRGRSSGSNLSLSSGYGWSPGQSPRHAQEESRDDEREMPATRNENSSSEKDSEPESSGQTDYDDQQSVVESHYEDAQEGDYEEDEAYEKSPSVPAPPETTPHEDREDAFDYENFFLHSTMGTYTKAKTRRQSYSSTGSVETTRPIHRSSISKSPRSAAKHTRASSIDSVSTEATFATATEGEHASDDDEGDPEDDINNILYLDRKLRGEDVQPHQQYPQHNGVNGYGQNRPGSRRPSNISISRSRECDEDDLETPRAPRGRPSFSDNPNKSYFPVNRNSQILTPPGSSLGEAPGSATPTSAFVSSLVSSVSTSSPAPGSSIGGSSGLNNDDTRLLEQLFQSLGKVCLELQAITNNPDADPKAARVYRRRLDAARRVLDGQLDT